jgi:hypothetical protein
MTLHSFRGRALGVIPIRLGLGLVLLGAARLAGASNAPALLAFAVGAFGITFVIFNDPRAFFARGESDPLDAPPDAVVAPIGARRSPRRCRVPSPSRCSGVSLSFRSRRWPPSWRASKRASAWPPSSRSAASTRRCASTRAPASCTADTEPVRLTPGDRRVAVHDDADRVAVHVRGATGRVRAQVAEPSRLPAGRDADRPRTKTPSSGATRGSPRSFTVANATCFVPCKYFTTWRALSRRSGVTIPARCGLACAKVLSMSDCSSRRSSSDSNISARGVRHRRPGTVARRRSKRCLTPLRAA